MTTHEVRRIDPRKDERWDPFVEAHPFGLIYHTSAWAKVLETSFKHIRAHYLGLLDEDSGEIKAALPLYEVKSWVLGNRLSSLPYATLCDPLVCTKDEFEILFRSATELLERSRCKYVEIRSYETKEAIGDGSLRFRSGFKHHYLPLNQDQQLLLKGMKRTFRQCIRQAEKAGVEVYKATEEGDLKDFYGLYLKTRKRLSLPPQPYHFIDRLWNVLHNRNYLTMLIARYQQKNIGGMILLKFKHRVSAEYLVSDEKYFHIRPNHLFFWTAIKMAKEEGYEIFDFGRSAADNAGLLRFKRGWGTTETNLFHSYYPNGISGSMPGQKKTSLKLLSLLCKHLPNPAYCALGNLIYHHHG